MPLRTIKLSIRSSGETDSPTVEDLLDQIRDYFDILQGVEQALADDGVVALEWRVVRAETNSPIKLEAQAFSRSYAVNVDRRAEIVTRATALGLAQLRDVGERPPYFTDDVLKRAERLFSRVNNGLAQTIIDHGAELPEIKITPVVAREAAAHIRAALTPPQRPYDEIGSVEGFAKAIARDGWGHLILWLKLRSTGEDVKCVVRGAQAESQIGDRHVRDVWHNLRVLVSGKLHYKGVGNLASVDAETVRFLRDRNELPDVTDILDEDFTGGLRSEDYLARLRDGELS